MLRIIVSERDKKRYEACLEKIENKKVICREEGSSVFEAIGILVTKNYKDLGLHEVIKIDPTL